VEDEIVDIGGMKWISKQHKIGGRRILFPGPSSPEIILGRLGVSD